VRANRLQVVSVVAVVIVVEVEPKMYYSLLAKDFLKIFLEKTVDNSLVDVVAKHMKDTITKYILTTKDNRLLLSVVIVVDVDVKAKQVWLERKSFFARVCDIFNISSNTQSWNRSGRFSPVFTGPKKFLDSPVLPLRV
jgi:hypothetical protein